MYNSLIIRNSYLAEIQFTLAPANNQRVQFLDIPQLRDVDIVGVEAFSASELTISPNGNTMIANLKGLLLTLCVGSTEKFYQMPCYTLESPNQGGIIREFARIPITLTKSYVTIVDAATITQNYSVCFNFYYNQRGANK